MSSFFIGLSLIAVFVVSLIFPPQDAYASITEKDLQVAARTFNFIDGIHNGPVVISVIYDKKSPESVSEAKTIEKILTGGLQAGKHLLLPKLTEISELDKIKTKVAFISSDLQKYHDQIYDITSKKQIFTVTKDFTCLQAQRCIMAVETLPSVKIEISSAAATGSRLAFGKALTMMIKMKK